MIKILDGKKLAEEILKGLKKKIKKTNLKLALGVVLVGENPVSKIYISQKRKVSQKVGINFKLFKFSSRITTKRLKEGIKKIPPSTSGLIIQLPLSKKINTQEVLNVIPPEKDVDCLSEKNLGKFYTDESLILPPVVNSISKLFKKYKIKTKGRNIVIVGAGRLVGKPLTIWFLQKGATVSVLNKLTKNTSFFTRNADILVSGAGKPNLITGEMVKKGAVVIDAGTSYKKPQRTPPLNWGRGLRGKGKLVGDIDLKSVSKKASYLAPVPGGVGPLTVACLLENLVELSISGYNK